MSDFNLEARIYWWGMNAAGVAITAAALLSLRSLTIGDWIKLVLLIGLILLSSRFPLHIPNTDASVSVSDVFVFLGVFFLGTGPAILLGVVDSFVTARATGRRITSWILSPSLMAITVLLSSTVFRRVLEMTLGQGAPWPIGRAEISFGRLFPALAALALVQYLTNGWLVAWFYARRAGKSPYGFWRSGYLWTSWTFFASAIAAGMVYSVALHHGFMYIAAVTPIIVASYLTYKIYFEHINEKTLHIEEVSRLHLATVEALASAIDAKDQTTHGHVRRVQVYAEGLARLYSLSDAEIEALKIGALLHDVGKLAVPDHILNKPAKLTAAEFEKMKIHPIVGAQILERVKFPYPVVPVVRHHHEKWDGSGYPDGLKGDEIPITARILSVVDCFDAVHEDRQYRKGLTREQAIELLKRGAGSQFDPRVVQSFLEHLPEFEEVIAREQIEEGERLPLPPQAQSDAQPATRLATDPKTKAEAPNYINEIKRAHQEVYALYEVAHTLGSSLNIEDAMAIIANKLGYVVRFDTCAIYRYYEASGVGVAEHVTGLFSEYLRGRCVMPGEGVTGYVLANRQALTHADPRLDFSDVLLPPEVTYTAAAAFPLQKKDRLLGAIAIYSTTLPDYTDDDLRLLEKVGRLAADALDNAIRYAETRSDALTDPLTGLPNSRALNVRFEQHAARADLAGSSFHLLMLDLDNFKPINDTYGHRVGDDFLKALGGLLASQFGEYDFFARYAGDEFVALVNHSSDQQCGELCGRLQRAVDQFAFCVRPMKYAKVGISIGTALYGRDGTTLDKLLLAADREMYVQKNSRKLKPIAQSPDLAYTAVYGDS